MRIRDLRVILLSSLPFVAGCGAEEPEEAVIPEVAAEAPATVAVASPAAPGAQHGGALVAAGDQQVEVVPYRDGNVHAFVAVPGPVPPEETRLTVRLPGNDGQVHPVVLTWDPSAGRYRGRLHRAQPVPGPVEVTIVARGETYRGRAPQVVVVAPPAGPNVVVQAPPSPTVVVERPAPPSVVVERPAAPTVVVERPAPPTVVVERPAPPTVVVQRPAAPTIVVERPAPPTVVVERPRAAIVVERPSPTIVVNRPGIVVEHSAPSVVVHHGGPHVRVRHDNGRRVGHFRHGRH